MSRALERVLVSKYFIHAPMKQKFLKLICEYHLSGRGSELNEYLIGKEVFDRDDSYNPANDPIVRVGAYGIREKLEIYYEKEGADDEVRIILPLGSYDPQFIENPKLAPLDNDEPASIETDPGAAARTSEQNIAVAALFRYWPHLLIVMLLGVIAFLGYQNYRLETAIRAQEAETEPQKTYREFWSGMFVNGSPTLIVLSNPPVFRFINSADPEFILRKSIPLNDKQSSEIFREMPNKSILKIIPSPRLTLTSDVYTGLGEAIGLQRLTDVFRSIDKDINLKQSRTVSAEDLKNHNVIILGSVWVNNWSRNLPSNEEFVYTSEVTIRNLNPRHGEKPEYVPVYDQQNGKLLEDYALITVGPNISEKEWVMLLSGLHSEGTYGAAEYLTSPHYLKEFTRRLSEYAPNGRPRFFQALLKIGVENAIPTTVSLVSLRELKTVKR